MKLRYVIAQGIILVFWASDWYENGASNKPGGVPSILSPLIFLIALAGIPVLVVGLIDGLAGAREESFLKNLILSALVITLTLWFSFFGITSMHLEDLFGQTGDPPSVAFRIGGLIAMEVLLFFEFSIAVGIRRLRERQGT